MPMGVGLLPILFGIVAKEIRDAEIRRADEEKRRKDNEQLFARITQHVSHAVNQAATAVVNQGE